MNHIDAYPRSSGTRRPWTCYDISHVWYLLIIYELMYGSFYFFLELILPRWWMVNTLGYLGTEKINSDDVIINQWYYRIGCILHVLPISKCTIIFRPISRFGMKMSKNWGWGPLVFFDICLRESSIFAGALPFNSNTDYYCSNLRCPWLVRFTCIWPNSSETAVGLSRAERGGGRG